jgi:hypothetical protein
LRKFLSKDAADRAMDNADIGTVRRLNELPDSERTARDKALVNVGKKLGFGEEKTGSCGRQASHGSMERSILAASLLRFLVMVVAI